MSSETSLFTRQLAPICVHLGQVFPWWMTAISLWPQLETKLNTGEIPTLTTCERGKERGTRQDQECRPRCRRMKTQ